ncbi:MAG: hemolysin III family protein [Caulobacterales bacterium]|nr:hemolysin III family protein [Caulobacterales bacterium]
MGGTEVSITSAQPHAVWYPQQSRLEWIADAVVHLFGIVFAVGGCIALLLLATLRSDIGMFAALGIYAIGLLSMLCCSLLYNINTNVNFKTLFARIDMAAIFIMIAGTYTPFALFKIGGALGVALLAVVWSVAIIGAGLRLFTTVGTPKMFIVAYMFLGWLILTALHPLFAALSALGIALLVAGGVLYSVGVVFHVWERLRFNSAVWHAFVVGAATCHFVAVMNEIVITA